MESISGFLSSDGKFFTSAEACRAHEDQVVRVTAIKSRAKEVVNFFSSGSFLSRDGRHQSGLPEALANYIANIPEECIEWLWNDRLINLFVDDLSSKVVYEIPSLGGNPPAEMDSLTLALETTHRLLAYVFEESV